MWRLCAIAIYGVRYIIASAKLSLRWLCPYPYHPGVGTKLKIKRLIPAEAVMVSLAGKPSAKQSRLIAVQRLEGATDELVDAATAGADLPAPEGKVCREVKFSFKAQRAEEGSRLIYALAYNPGWSPEPGKAYTREEIAKHVDSHGTFMRAEDIDKVARRFLKISRGIDTNHDMNPGAAIPVESFVVRSADGWRDDELGVTWPHGGWVLASEVTRDETWERCQRGMEGSDDPDAITGYSVFIYAREEEMEIEVADAEPAGRTEPEVIDEPEATQRTETEPEPELKPEKRGLLAFMRAALGWAKENDIDVEGIDLPEAEAHTRADAWSDFNTVWPLIAANAQFGELYYALRRVVECIRWDDDIDDKPMAMAAAFDAAKVKAIDLHTTIEGVRGQLRSEVEDDPFGLNAALRVEEALGQIDEQRLATLREAAASLNNALATARGEEDEVNEEQLRALLAEATQPLKDELSKVTARIDAVEAKRTENTEAEPETEAKPEERTEGEDVAAMLRTLLPELLAPIQESVKDLAGRTERLEGTAPAPSQARNENTSEPTKRVDGGYLDDMYGPLN